MTTTGRCLTVAELAERWRTTPAAIYSAKRFGRVPASFRRGGGKRGPLLFREPDVEAYERENLIPA